ncbi:MAG: 30S ribosomal protein S6 [Candidatus Magasanikbacteria bacterium]|nr:30S ribosomal protein S6 [Candidatus Magasanikbacteria bacterium]
MMKHYEMLCVLPGTLSEDEIAPMVQGISQVLGNYHVQNMSLEDMGKSRLAYPIKLIRYGYFQLFRFDLESTYLEKMEKSVRLVGGFLRVIVQISDLSKEHSYTLALDPTALSAPKKSDEERREERRFERKTAQKKQEQIVHHLAEVKIDKEPAPFVQVEAAETVLPKKEEEKITEVKPKRVAKNQTDISLDTIDARLDEILQQDIDKV